MMRYVESAWLLFFLFGLLLLGTLGTWDETAPFWYGGGFMAVAGVGNLLSRHRQPARPPGWICVSLMLGFYAYVAWRALNSEVQWIARQDLVFATTAITAYILIAMRFTDSRQRGGILAAFAVLILANVITGLYQFFQDQNFMVFESLGFGRVTEKSASGFFGNSNHMAGFLILASFPLLGVAVLGRGVSPFLRSLCGVIFAVGGLGVGFSTSRGGVVGFFCALPLFICLALVILKASAGKRQTSGKAMGWWFLSLTGGFALLLTVSVLAMRKFYGTTDFMSHLSGRSALWDAALEQWQTSPIIGTGARSYEYMERAFRTLDTNWMTYVGEFDAIYAHNDLLQCLADYGIVGLLLILTAVVLHFIHALLGIIRIRQKPDGDSGAGMATGLAAGSLCSLAGIAVHSMVDFNLHIGINVVMAAILMGFLAAPGFSKPRPSASSGKTIPPAFSPALLGFALVTAGLSVIFLNKSRTLAPADYYWAKGSSEVSNATSVSGWLAASGTLENAISLDPENAHAWRFLGILNTSLAKEMAPRFASIFYRKALDQLTHSLRLYPQNPYAAGLAGSLADYLGEKQQAEAFFATAMRWGLNIESVNNQFGDHLAIFKKQYPQAIGYYAIALQLCQDRSEKANIQRKIDKCMAKLKERGEAAPPEAFIKPGEVPEPAGKTEPPR
ncbi:MAG: O-antigen ligase family protein [Verrucomicrobiota bacterium]